MSIRQQILDTIWELHEAGETTITLPLGDLYACFGGDPAFGDLKLETCPYLPEGFILTSDSANWYVTNLANATVVTIPKSSISLNAWPYIDAATQP